MFQDCERVQLVEENVDEMYNKLKEEIGDIPFIMPLSINQYGRGEYTGNLSGSLMTSFVVFCDD